MKLLLDEFVPRRLKNDLRDHDVRTVAEVGLKGVTNGHLLLEATNQHFDVVITVDRNILFQHNLSQFNLAFIVLIARPCRYSVLKSLVPKVLETLQTIKRGTIHLIQ